MPDATARRYKTPLVTLLGVGLLIAIPVGIIAQAGGQAGRGAGQGRGGGAPVGAPAAVPPAPGAPPAGGAAAQAGGGRGAGAPQGAAPAVARTAAPVDLTGYWVSIVTEDWIERMAPDSPPSGVIRGGGGGRGGGRGAVPPPPAGEQCRVYGAGGSMRVPGRLNITWADDNTLKIDLDAGTQTRLLRFNAPAPAPGTPKSLQGYSVATWETGGGARGGGRGGAAGAPAAPRWGSLNVVTTNMSGGYLLSSRSAYSENAVLTEYFTKHTDFGQEYLTVTAQLVDGGQTRIVSSTFKKEPNGSKFSPSGCEIVR
jgi:hypothetical protein